MVSDWNDTLVAEITDDTKAKAFPNVSRVTADRPL
jgi:hypothetical protein